MGEWNVPTISSSSARVELGTESSWLRPKSLGRRRGMLLLLVEPGMDGEDDVEGSGFRGVSDERAWGRAVCVRDCGGGGDESGDCEETDSVLK